MKRRHPHLFDSANPFVGMSDLCFCIFALGVCISVCWPCVDYTSTTFAAVSQVLLEFWLEIIVGLSFFLFCF